MRVAMLVVLALVTACGRIGFDATPLAGDAPAGRGDVGDSGDSGGSGADATLAPAWTVLQVKGTDGGTLPVTSTGAAHLIVIALESGLGTDKASAVHDDAPGGTSAYVSLGSAARCLDAETSVGVELWYAPSSHPGASTIVADGPVGAMVAWEVATIGSPAADAAIHADDQPSTAMPTASITTTRPGDFVVAAMRSGNEISGTLTGGEFIEDAAINNDGWAHLSSATAAAGAHQVVWTEGTPGGFCASLAAFSTR